MKIGAYLIAKDEEEMISRCLASLKGCDSIVVLDTGSTDNTVEIAKQFTDQVYTHYTWENDFSKARNESLKHLDADWCLVIDCDEILEDGAIDKIRSFLESARRYEKYDALKLTVVTMAEDGSQARVHRKDPSIYWERPAHNVLVHDQTKTYKLDIKIYSDFSPAHLNDPYRTIKILSDSIAKDPADLRNYYYMGREFMFKSDFGNAMYFFKKYIEKCPVEMTSNELADVYYSLAQCFMAMGDRANAAYNCGLSLVAMPDFSEPALMLSNLYNEPEKQKFWIAYAKMCTNSDAIFTRNIDLVKK